LSLSHGDACPFDTVAIGHTYQVRVDAWLTGNVAAPEGVSNEVSIEPPSAPVNVVASLDGPAGSQSVSVTWEAPLSTGDLAVVGYNVKCFEDGVLVMTSGAGLNLFHSAACPVGTVSESHTYQVGVDAWLTGNVAAPQGLSTEITLGGW
jgi:hypothetical protein